MLAQVRAHDNRAVLKLRLSLTVNEGSMEADYRCRPILLLLLLIVHGTILP